MIKEFDTVVLLRDIATHKLESGDIGTVVHNYGNGTYEVEFVTGEGNTLGVFTLEAKDIRKMEGSEILHARAIA